MLDSLCKDVGSYIELNGGIVQWQIRPLIRDRRGFDSLCP